MIVLACCDLTRSDGVEKKLVCVYLGLLRGKGEKERWGVSFSVSGALLGDCANDICVDVLVW